MESPNGLGEQGPSEATQPNPLPWQGHLQPVLPAQSSLAWDVPEDGASPTSLGNLGWGFPTLRVKNSFLRSDL